MKLLAPGETPVYPDYRIPQTEADAIADKMAMQEHGPFCATCKYVAKAFQSLSSPERLPKDVDVISHHMFTK